MSNEPTNPVILTSGIFVHPCDLCGSTESTPIEAARPYIGDNDPPEVCNSCGFIFVRNRRSPEEVAAAWTALWGEDSYTSAWPAVKARLTYVAEWIDQNIGLKGKSVLDIGAGEGKFLEIVRKRCGGVWGIEPSMKNVLRMTGNDIGAYCGTIENAVIDPIARDKRFDIVTINWTLENCSDCIGFLKKAREFLKPDGHLVVATGSRINVPFKKPLSTYFSKNPADTHCFRFSANSLGMALVKSGLRPAQSNRFNDSDWLVLSANLQPLADGHPPSRDDPQEVLQFFNDWAEMWP